MTPEEIEYLQSKDRARTASKALLGLEGDPDQAAAAVELEKKTGVPSERINGNFENFSNDYRSMLTQRMLDRNPNLSAYLDAHPMAAIVSKDDWNRMADFYDKLENYKYMLPGSRAGAGMIHGAITGFARAMGEMPYGKWVDDEVAKHPWLGKVGFGALPTIAKAYAAPFETVMHAFSALPAAAYGGAYGGSIAGGMSESSARKLAREMGGIAEYATAEMVGTGLHGPHGQFIQMTRMARELGVPVKEMTKAVDAAMPYIRANEQPPMGTHPLWDAMRGEEVKDRMSIYDALVEAADKTNTKARSPELIEIAAKLIDKSNIYIHWDKVKQLYGDKLPEAGDKLLGDIPGVAEQFKAAMETETDIAIPMSHWLSKVDPELVKALHDDVRLRPDDLTLKEVEKAPTTEQALAEMGKVDQAEVVKEKEAARPTPEQLRDAGFTESEIAGGRISPEMLQQVHEGYMYLAGQWRKPTELDLKVFKDAATKDAERYAKGKAELDKRFKEAEGKVGTAAYPDTGDILGSDWQFHIREQGGDYKRGAYAALEQGTQYNKAMVGKIERALERQKAAEPAIDPEVQAALDRMTALRTELQERLQTHGTTESVMSKEGNLLQSLIAVSGQETLRPDAVLKAVRWAAVHNRPDIVTRGIELAKYSNDAELEARLQTEAANIDRTKSAQDAVNREMASRPWGLIEAGEDFPTMKQLIADPAWKRIGVFTIAKGAGHLTETEALVRRLVSAVFENLAGEGTGVKLLTVREARMGLERPTPVEGAYVMPTTGGILKDPTIAIVLAAADPVRALGHEFMHHLYRYRFLRDAEYNALVKQAEREGWIEKHQVREKYPEGSPELLKEEAVMDEFGTWLSKRLDERVAHPNETIFKKIENLLIKVKAFLKELFGMDLTAEEIFRKIEEREVQARAPEGPSRFTDVPIERAAAPEIEVPKIEAPEPLGLLGLLPKGRESRYLRLINAINEKQVQKVFGEAFKEETKRQTQEWKKNFAYQFEQSMSDLKNRPDFRAAALFRNGIIGDEKLDFVPKLDPTKLTPEQVAKLPTRWFNKTEGFDPNDLAGTFGFKTGSDMIDSIIRLEEARGRQKPENFIDRMAYHETERRMEMQYGKLDENILREAREHAIGLERFDLLHEETLLLAAKAGHEFPFSKEYFRDQARLQFVDSQQAQLSVIKYTREIGRSTKLVEDAFLKGDYLAAFVERQRTLRLMAQAEQAKALEVRRVKFDKITDRYKKREVAGRPPEFTNWVHHIMFRINKPPRRSVQDLQANIDAHPEKSLEEFSAKHSIDGLPHSLDEYGVEYNSSLPIAEFLMEKDATGQLTWNKAVDSMTVGEFEQVHNSIIALDTVGRRTAQYIAQGKAHELNELVDKLAAQAKTLGEAWIPPAGEKTSIQKTRMFLQHMRAGLLQMEFVWDRLDKGKRGLYTRMFTDRFAEAGDEFRIMTRDYSRMLNRLAVFNKGVDLKAQIPHDILFDPLKGLPEEGKPPGAGMILLNKGSVSRQTFRVIMLNVGNPSNLDKMARGYGTTPEKIMDWVNKHATQQDWMWAQGIGKILEDMQDKADVMTMNMTGVKMERLPLGTVQTAFGKIPGWYYPMKYDTIRGGGRRAGVVEMNPPPLVRVATAHGWERKRTGYAGPLDFTLEGLTTEMGRRVRDIAFREVVSDVGRIFRHRTFQDAMTNHMGPSYTQLLMPYLEDIAGLRGPTASASQAADAFFQAAQRNLIHVFIGYKISTILKHTPTAFVQSFGEVGPVYMAKAAFDLYRTNKDLMTTNNKFMMEGAQIGNLDWKGSGTLQGRRAHWQESFGASMDKITGHMNLGERSAYWGSMGIAVSDLAASKILWLAKYREVMDKLKPKDTAELARYKVEEAHTEAAIQANQAVRRTHGETVITSRPQFMRNPAWRNLTALYGFFNHIFNRYYRMSWQTAEMFKHPKDVTAKDVRQLAGAFFLNVVVPAAFEEWATAKATDDEHGLIYHGVHALLHPVWSAVPLVREVMSAVSMGADPGFGIMQGGMKAFTDMVRIGGKLQKKGEIGREDVGDVISHGNNLIGLAFRLPFTDQLGKWEKYAFNYFNRIEPAPQNWREFRLMVHRGTIREPRRH